MIFLFSGKNKAAVLRPLCILCTLSLISALLTSFVVLQAEQVTVTEDGKQTAQFLSLEQDTDALLKHAGVEVGTFDAVSVKQAGHKITVAVEHAFDVTVIYGGKTVCLQTTSVTVEEALKKANIVCAEQDKVTPALNERVQKDTVITVVCCTVKYETQMQTVPFETITKQTDALYEGESEVTQKGVDGQKKVTYKLTYQDGKLVDKSPEQTEIIRAVQNEEKEVGTKKKQVVTDEGTFSFSKVLTVCATAYSGEISSGKITCLGKVPHWGTVAVDPRVIPLGTKMYIASEDGSTVYGYCVAGDTGGAIRGNRVDLFMPTERECRAFGRRTMKVYILN